MSLVKVVLQRMPSPLEVCVCIAVVDVSAARNCFRSLLAVTCLFLVVCDWHVPQVLSYHNFICRVLSAMCMQALVPHSPTLACLAFLYPTFGKRGRSMSTTEPEFGLGASEHISTSVDEALATTSTELFIHDREEDRVVLDWLKERSEHPRCAALLQQIVEWNGKCNQAEMRSLAKAQGIILKRVDHSNKQSIREAVRRHFKAAVGQEKASNA